MFAREFHIFRLKPTTVANIDGFFITLRLNAFVGLSKPRYERFEGLALDAKLAESDSEPWCGIQVIDLNTGSCVQWFRIDGEVSELYDVAVLPGVACAKSLGVGTDEALDVITLEE